jgi:hypothetical protein
MANPHFANLGDVWKHLSLTEVISWLQPGHYVETHAGSAIYRLVDDPASVADLQAARERLGLRDKVRVIHGDGLAETAALLQAHALFREVTIAAPAARAWCAELRVGGQRAKTAGIGSAAASCSRPRTWLRSGRCCGPPTPTFARSTSRASQPMPAYTSRPAS